MNDQSETINELATALAKAQGEIRGAAKDSQNPYFRSSYADLASVWDACRTALSKNGLAVIQTTELVDTGIVLITTLAHSSGQWIRSRLPVKPVKGDDPQGLGSAITYMRRYSLAAIAGVAPEDDDGNAASGRPKTPPPPDAGQRTQGIPPTTDEPRHMATDTQVSAIYDLIDASKTEKIKIIKFLDKFGAKEISALTVEQADEMIVGLKAKQAAQDKKAGK